LLAVGLHTCTAVARSLCVSWAFLYHPADEPTLWLVIYADDLPVRRHMHNQVLMRYSVPSTYRTARTCRSRSSEGSWNEFVEWAFHRQRSHAGPSELARSTHNNACHHWPVHLRPYSTQFAVTDQLQSPPYIMSSTDWSYAK